MTDNEITFEIRGAIYDVYKKLGPGLLEINAEFLGDEFDGMGR